MFSRRCIIVGTVAPESYPGSRGSLFWSYRSRRRSRGIVWSEDRWVSELFFKRNVFNFSIKPCRVFSVLLIYCYFTPKSVFRPGWFAPADVDSFRDDEVSHVVTLGAQKRKIAIFQCHDYHFMFYHLTRCYYDSIVTGSLHYFGPSHDFSSSPSISGDRFFMAPKISSRMTFSLFCKFSCINSKSRTFKVTFSKSTFHFDFFKLIIQRSKCCLAIAFT